jgi:hypothetical protein
MDHPCVREVSKTPRSAGGFFVWKRCFDDGRCQETELADEPMHGLVEHWIAKAEGAPQKPDELALDLVERGIRIKLKAIHGSSFRKISAATSQ